MHDSESRSLRRAAPARTIRASDPGAIKPVAIKPVAITRSVVSARLVAALLAVGVLLFGPGMLPAYAEGTASSVEVTADLTADGTLTVEEQITFAGEAPDQVQQTFETTETLVGNRSRVYDLSDISVSSGGEQIEHTVTTDGDLLTVSFEPGDAESVTVSYTVSGAVVDANGQPALRWRVLQGLSLTVEEFRATVTIPGAFSYVRCTSGPPNATTPCTTAAAGTHETGNTPTFTDGPRGEGEVVGIDIGFPPGTVTVNEKIIQHWTVGRAFSAKPWPLGLSIGLLVLGGIALIAAHRRGGRDTASREVVKPAEFVPVGAGESEFRVVGDVRPGQVGTVVDERVDPIDITASLLDLAVRGHLVITELTAESKFARSDWELTRVPAEQAPGDLRPFEQRLLDAIAPAGESARVSELGDRIGASVDDVQSALYDEMVHNGWFTRRPDAIRSVWTRIGAIGLIAAVLITVVLAAFTQFGLVGIALIILGLGLIFVGQEMPSRTAQGSALLAGLGALRSDLLSSPTDQMPAGRELSELSEVLPYAVVLGGADRWIDAIVATDEDQAPDSTELSWYHGPDDWHLSDLPDSLRNFVTTVSGTLFSR